MTLFDVISAEDLNDVDDKDDNQRIDCVDKSHCQKRKKRWAMMIMEWFRE